ncbi:hypothetical protein SAMD00019534_018800 [Acytostelium subglobosum LB1]|uniref:hypothetical protein n=1 Tax=Acytostelium subglobosum LB1 TaxID=1410327 RepID=UPI000644F1EA|nr:hypothetical protein SAMD00019534_018800 [Acytostelium subglobosum LB1]GAM18705.1 hypothetical protein SAMD00019534_018800 [Acytostelium subglobosum LB1]|eukprot:XP_012757925.1 hypothetical protein SAMD00019534_018800 [Acytostelium subglobosum LB1]
MSDLFNSNKLTVQPWGDFVKWGSFNIPDKQFKDRAETNLGYYSGNYAIIVGAVLLLTLFTNYTLLFSVLVIAGAAYFAFVLRPQVYNVGGFRLESLHQMIILAVVSSVLVYKTSGLTLLYTTLFSLLIVLGHSLTRKRSINSKVNEKIGKAKDFVKEALD